MSDAIRELIVSINFDEVDINKLTKMDRAIDGIEDSLQDLGGDLSRLGSRADQAGAEGARAMDRLERHTDDAGDAMEELGRDATRAGDRTEEAAREAAKDIDRLGRQADSAMEEMQNGAGRASDAVKDLGGEGDKAGDEIRASSDRAADALLDMGNSAERAAGDIIRAGGRADSELEDVARSADKAGDALEAMGQDGEKLSLLIATLDNVNDRIALQERKLRDLRESLDNTFNESKRDKLRDQILKTEAAIISLTKQSNRTSREIWKIEDAARDAAQAAEKVGDVGGKAMDELGDEVQQAERKFDSWRDRMAHFWKSLTGGADKAKEAIDEVGDEAAKAGDKGKQGTSKFLDALDEVVPKGKTAGIASALFSNPWVAAAGAVVAAIGGIGIAISGLVNQAEADFGRMQAQLGYTDTQMAGIKDTVMDVYGQGFGESMREVGDNVAILRQSFKDLDDETIGTLTAGAYTLKDLFGAEVKEVSKAVKTMTANFDGLSETEAMDLITTGFQQGGDYANDFLDTVNEYSLYFDKMGVGADKFIGTLIKGGEAGAFNLDKVGDSFKELSIRAIDGSKATTEAFQALGFDSKKMGSDFAVGGETAERALMATVSALSFVDDAQERNKIGVELFGTQWEDMRENVIFAIDGAEEAVAGFEGATERATDTMQDNVGTKWTQITRQFKNGLIEAFAGSDSVMSDMLDGVLAFMPQIQEGIGMALEWVKGLFADNQEDIAKYTEGLQGFFTGLWNVIQGIWNVLGPFITDTFVDSMKLIWNIGGTVLGALGDIFDVFGHLLQGNWGEAWNSVKDLFSGVMDGLLGIGEALLEKVFGAFDNTVGRIINLFTDFSLEETGKDIINGLIKGITSMAGEAVEAVKDVAGNIWGGVKDFFGIKSPSRLMAELGGFVVDGLTVGIDDKSMQAVEAAKALSDGVVTETKEVTSIIHGDEPRGEHKPKGGPPPLPGGGTPPPPGIYDPEPGPTAAPTVQISFGDIIVQMPEGGATRQDAQNFADEISRQVEERVAALFTQLGIAFND